MTPDPSTLYTARLAERRAELAHRQQRHRRLGHGKLAMAACGVALVWLALAQNTFSILWVLVPIAGFVLLVVLHEKLLQELERRRRAARFFEKALARLDGNWAGTGETGDRYSDPAHPYAVDLDLFGKGSVFELLCTARTRIGEDRLAQWLKAPATPEVVRARHAAVDELRERVDLREELAIVAEEARSGVDPVHLAQWGEAPAALRQSGYRLRVRLQTVLGLAGFAALWIHLLRSANLIKLTDGVDGLVRDLFLVAVVVKVLEPFILWTPHLALQVEDWRALCGTAVRRWLHAAGEMEALCSLASHAFEHPADPFPEFAPEGPWIDAEAIGHPLLAEDKVVRNDIRIGGALRVIVVSGSNMSGKSTMLRTLGVNEVLAQAGAPVRARRLTLSPLAVGASIRLTDSLQGGVSRFYAEILRLRQILDETAGPLPVLFLIDEFLHGTNSHDRRIGAGALVRGLVQRGAIGLVTTHDLALADIAGELGESAANVHFEDQIAGGKISFDYHM